MKDPPDPELARLTGRAMARFAHDINNIAMVWGGHLDLVRGGHEEPAEAWAAFDAALEHLRRLSEGIKNLGLLGTDAVSRVAVNDLVREAGRAQEAGAASLTFDLDPAAPVVTIRHAEVATALGALLANAHEASPAGAPIHVRTRFSSAEGCVTVEIEDAGPGFADTVRQRNFDPLVSTRGARGRGIGLTLARLVALAHGGSLVLENRPEGGARAIFSLPAR